jgi:polysaccharide biosynthesis protein PslH
VAPAPPMLVIVPHVFVPPRNGGNIYSFKFCEFLQQLRPLICYSARNNHTGDLPFPLTRQIPDGKSKFINPKLMWSLYSFCKTHKIRECILSQPFYGMVALPVLRMLRIKAVVIVHNLEYQRFRSLGKWWWPLAYGIEWLVYKSADGLLFVSKQDLEQASSCFGLPSPAGVFTPHGTELARPDGRQKKLDRNVLLERFQLAPDTRLYLIYGPLTYFPNREALSIFIENINPHLISMSQTPYMVFVCGGGLDEIGERPAVGKVRNILCLGYVDEIETFVTGVDLVLNVSISGGGAKSKVIEAVAHGTSVISTRSGAIGLDLECFGEQVSIVNDDDYTGFARKIIEQSKAPKLTPVDFFETYSWSRIVTRAADYIRTISPRF